MAFKTMDPAVARALIEKEQDILTPAARMDAELYKLARCPTCGHTGADKIVDAPKVDIKDGAVTIERSPFSASNPIIQGHAKCQGCGVEYNPVSGLIIKATHPILTGVQR